jgi:hypothetical protein
MATYPSAPRPETVSTGDVNGDGLVDVVTGNKNGEGDSVSVLEGLAGGGFDEPFTYGAAYPMDLLADDVDGNGTADILVPSYANHVVTVRRGDYSPPDIEIMSGPANEGMTNDSTPTFGFSASEPVEFKCGFDEEAPGPCSSASSHTSSSVLSDGVHSFAVQGTDEAGNPTLAPTFRSFAVDTDSPVVSFTNKPKSRTSDKTPTFQFTATDPELQALTLTCKMDSKPVSGCASPVTSKKLKSGSHTFVITAKDPAGNTAEARAKFKVK